MVTMSARGKTGLSTDDLASLTTALSAGKRATVYLRDPMPSLDLPAGASARVISVDGSTVTVRPKGVDDQLPFEADELLKTRTAAIPTPARPRPVKATPAPSAPSGASTAPKPIAPETKPTSESAKPTSVQPNPVPPKPVRRPKPATAVSVTITSVGDTAWTVSLSHGTKKQGKATEVTSDRVARAMQMLGDDAAIQAVNAVIESARAAAQKRIDELSQELEAAKAMLAHLEVQAEGSDDE